MRWGICLGSWEREQDEISVSAADIDYPRFFLQYITSRRTGIDLLMSWEGIYWNSG